MQNSDAKVRRMQPHHLPKMSVPVVLGLLRSLLNAFRTPLRWILHVSRQAVWRLYILRAVLAAYWNDNRSPYRLFGGPHTFRLLCAIRYTVQQGLSLFVKLHPFLACTPSWNCAGCFMCCSFDSFRYGSFHNDPIH